MAEDLSRRVPWETTCVPGRSNERRSCQVLVRRGLLKLEEVR